MANLDNGDCGCENKLEITKIHARCAKICWLKSKKSWSEEITLNDICAQSIQAKSLSVEDEVANHICAQDIISSTAKIDNAQFNTFCAQDGKLMSLSAIDANFNTLCAQDISVDKLCVKNLSANNVDICNVNRAYVSFAADSIYNLSTNINFDNIDDNPSGLFSLAPSKFTAPIAGYYEVSVSLGALNLAGGAIITGTPVAQLAVSVNGIRRKSVYVPFLSFSVQVRPLLSATILLAAGDIVTAEMDILVQDPTLGLISYVGTMTLIGGALASVVDASSMSFVLLTGLCTPEGNGGGEQVECRTCVAPIVTCPLPQVPCVPFTNPCLPVEIRDCDPCDEPTPPTIAAAKAAKAK